MKVAIICGGTGNKALYHGIRDFYPDCEIKFIVNAYDDGKSTGICRKITKTLGASDIRKNHLMVYQSTSRNCCYSEFLGSRHNMPKGKEKEYVLGEMKKWGIKDSVFRKSIVNFFNHKESGLCDYSDFNIGNIVYSSMFETYGYEWTMDYISGFLGIKQDVILNSHDNVYIKGKTEKGNVICSEGGIVEWKNKDDRINGIIYERCGKENGLNVFATRYLLDCNLIIISPGTFWSSIFPTFEYCGLYKVFNESKARKIWVMNNNEDFDSYGCTSEIFVNALENIGVNTNDIDIIANTDASETLRKFDSSRSRVFFYKMGNENGKHVPEKLCNAVFKTYVNLKENVMLDFDDTLWSRKSESDRRHYDISVDNIKMANKLAETKNVCIISGNSFSSIKGKLSKIYKDISEFKPMIVADANSVIYRNGKKQSVIKDFVIDSKDIAKMDEILSETNACEISETFIKLKPVTENRMLISFLLNDYFKNNNMKLCAKPKGLTTIDIVSENNDKSAVPVYINVENDMTYIGDALDYESDRGISEKSTNHYTVEDVFETNMILRTML